MLGYRYFELQKLLCDSRRVPSHIDGQDLCADVSAKSQSDGEDSGVARFIPRSRRLDRIASKESNVRRIHAAPRSTAAGARNCPAECHRSTENPFVSARTESALVRTPGSSAFARHSVPRGLD